MQGTLGNAGVARLMRQVKAATQTPPAQGLDEALQRRGDRGPDVADLQAKLNEVDAAALDVDGIFGPLTDAAVRRFQTEESLRVDGIVGPKTRGALARRVAPSDGPVPPAPGGLLGGGAGLIPGLLASGGLAEFLRRVREQFAEQERIKARREVLDLLREPRRNKQALLDRLPALDAKSAAEIVTEIKDIALAAVAGSAAGREVLEKLLDRMPEKDFRFSSQRGRVQSAIDLRRTSNRTSPTVDQQKALDRINKALSKDATHVAQYAAAATPLKFPVELRQPGLEDDGGVYFDPNLTEAGDTKTFLTEFGIDGVRLGRAFLLTSIHLGPDVLLGADTFIQATMFHEFQHYKRHLEYRLEQGTKSEVTRGLEEEQVASTSVNDRPLAETEAASTELAEMHAKLNDKDLKDVLLYLSRFMGRATKEFRDEAIDRVLTATSKDPVGRQRLIDAIDSLQPGSRPEITGKKRKAALKPLRDALARGRR